ncbi:short-chain dehydrogenase oxidoreductase [Colletotrichum chrysophilum]|uniref:Short-chain dehydrogenase oxidoreductase n=1 Tax=Colletotrichum chrysophilum TaxID=1836956 RepID=A0AAD9B0U5_9PEZI|nr:short-chain dehydrogenase oxidoreductase [Colletotrichum chrysophilum]
MAFPSKVALVTGASSGIGAALTARLIANGTFVIAVARRKDRLQTLLDAHGPDKVAAEPYDMTDLEGMPEWVNKNNNNLPGPRHHNPERRHPALNRLHLPHLHLPPQHLLGADDELPRPPPPHHPLPPPSPVRRADPGTRRPRLFRPRPRPHPPLPKLLRHEISPALPRLDPPHPARRARRLVPRPRHRGRPPRRADRAALRPAGPGCRGAG